MITVLELVLAPKEVEPDEVSIFHTNAQTMAETRCNGHNGVLGPANPKVSVRVGRKTYLLCKSCAKEQGLI